MKENTKFYFSWYFWATDDKGNVVKYLGDNIMNTYKIGKPKEYKLIIEPCAVCGNIEGQLRSINNALKKFPHQPDYVISISKDKWYAVSSWNQDEYNKMIELANTTFGKYPSKIITSSLDWYDIFYPTFVPDHYIELIPNWEVSKVTNFGPWVDKKLPDYKYYSSNTVVEKCNQTSIRKITDSV